jgi:Ca2+-binding EF-hand superfamily protein
MGSKDSKVKEKVQKKLTKKDIQELVKRTGMTEKEVQDLFNIFMANNQDGKLDKAEFARLYQILRKEPVANLDEITDFCFRGFDSDNSGCLTFHEFAIGYGLTSEGDPADKLAYAFEIYDSDNNGFLTPNEIKDGVTAMLDLLGADKKGYNINQLATECVNVLDSSKDGRVTKEEFINGLLKNYNLRVLMSPFN